MLFSLSLSLYLIFRICDFVVCACLGIILYYATATDTVCTAVVGLFVTSMIVGLIDELVECCIMMATD